MPVPDSKRQLAKGEVLSLGPEEKTTVLLGFFSNGKPRGREPLVSWQPLSEWGDCEIP